MRHLFLVGMPSLVGCEKPASVAAPVAEPPVRVVLDTLTADKAAELNGRPVVATLTVAKPFDFFEGKTIVGCRDLADRVERSAVLAGLRYDVDEGNKLTVTGRLRVIEHPHAIVNTVQVPAWREIRVVEGR